MTARISKVKTFLLDAKKAVACFNVGVSACVADGLLASATAAEITGVATVLGTVLVYALDNLT